MGDLFSKPKSKPQPPPVKQLPLLIFRAQYIGQPLATVLTALRDRGIDNITVAMKSRDSEWSPPPRRHTGRVFVLYSADSLLVQDVIYE